MTYLTPAQGRQPKIGVMFLAWLNIYQNLKQAIQDVIAPEMQQLRGDIRALSAEIGAVRQELTWLQTFVNRQVEAIDSRFDALKRDIDRRFDAADFAVNQRFSAVDTRLDGIDKRIDALASDWRLSLDVHERLAALEARLEKR